MSFTPMKNRGFQQGLYVQSSTKKEEIGTIRHDRFGNEYVYARIGGSAITKGKLCMMADVAAAVQNKTAVAASKGDMNLSLTIGSATYAADYFAGGYLMINDHHLIRQGSRGGLDHFFGIFAYSISGHGRDYKHRRREFPGGRNPYQHDGQLLRLATKEGYR